MYIQHRSIPTAPTDLIKIPTPLLLPSSSSILDLINFTFPHIHENYQDVEYLSTRAILTTTNRNTKLINEEILTIIPDPNHTKLLLTSTDSMGDDDDPAMYNDDILNQVELSGLPSHKLPIQQFAVMMLMRNLDPNRGLINGARMMVLHATRTLVTARLITGDFKGQEVLIPRITLSPSDGRLPFQLNRLQFPLKLAYCMTINKVINPTNIAFTNIAFTNSLRYLQLANQS